MMPDHNTTFCTGVNPKQPELFMTSSKQNKEFTESILPTWPLDQAIEWIQEHMKPEEVFMDDKLETWAINNGWEQPPNTQAKTPPR